MKPYSYKGLRQSVGLTSEEYSHIYKAWKRMLYRCYDPNNASYKYYKGRIDVCTEWRYSFENFLIWSLDNGWQKNLSLDRIDNDGNYEPSNCRWVTMKQQGRNRRSCIYLTHNGVTKTMMEWCEVFNIPYHVPSNRFRRGCADFDKLFSKVDYRSGGALHD